jgi:hypothetical protein
MVDVIEIDAQTGEVVEREFTTDELAQREADALAEQAEQQAAAEKAVADKAAREAAIAHAKSLGFTDAMIAVMYPNLAN